MCRCRSKEGEVKEGEESGDGKEGEEGHDISMLFLVQNTWPCNDVVRHMAL